MTNKQKNLIGNSRNGDETLSFYEIIAVQINWLKAKTNFNYSP